MKRITKNKVTIFIISFLILAGIIYLVPGVNDVLRSTYVLEYGELDVADETDGYFVRNETVYFSGKGGEANRYIKGNKLIRKGTAIMAVQGNSDAGTKLRFRSIRNGIGDDGITTTDYKSRKEGLVTYYADGYESEFTPATMASKTYEAFSSLSNDASTDLIRDDISKGDPVFKIVDRASWYIVCFVPKDHKTRYEKGKKMTININGEKNVVGSIYSISDDEDRAKLILKTNYYVKDFTHTRVADIKLTTTDSMGLIVQNSSITKEKGHEGVYVRQKNGDFRFVRIQVIATDGEKSVVTKSYFFDEKGKAVSTVNNYDEVLKRA